MNLLMAMPIELFACLWRSFTLLLSEVLCVFFCVNDASESHFKDPGFATLLWATVMKETLTLMMYQIGLWVLFGVFFSFIMMYSAFCTIRGMAQVGRGCSLADPFPNSSIVRFRTKQHDTTGPDHGTSQIELCNVVNHSKAWCHAGSGPSQIDLKRSYCCVFH